MRHRRPRLRQALITSAVAASALLAGACGAVVDKEELAAAAAAGGRLPAEVRREGKLVVATGDYKVPTHFKNDKGELVGLNIDLAKALGEKLGIEMELVTVPFDAVLAGIQAGRYDTALYNVSDSPERRKVLDFADYAISGLAIVTRAGERGGLTTDPLSLCGHSVAVTGGQYQFQVLNDKVQPLCEKASKPKIALRTFQSGDAAKNAVESGRAEALVDGMTTTPYMVSKSGGRFELVGKLTLDGDPLGMPFAKGRAALVTAVLAAWKALYTSGEYRRIAEKWSLTQILPASAEAFVVNSGEGITAGPDGAR